MELQRSKKLQALGIGDAEIELAVDHQSGSFEVLDVVAGRPLGILIGIVPGHAVELPEREPQFLGRARHAAQIEDAGMGNQGFEALGMAEHPVDHVAAVRPTGGPARHPTGLDNRSG